MFGCSINNPRNCEWTLQEKLFRGRSILRPSCLYKAQAQLLSPHKSQEAYVMGNYYIIYILQTQLRTQQTVAASRKKTHDKNKWTTS
jgi:hypothetical protein